MQRRGFLAGLLAAPVVATLAPQAKAEAPVAVVAKRGGFTAQELRNISGGVVRFYQDRVLFVGTDKRVMQFSADVDPAVW